MFEKFGECLSVLPAPEDVFMCIDPGRMDIYGKPMDDIHVEIQSNGQRIYYYCYGRINYQSTVFGSALTLEGACEIIAHLEPYKEGGQS